MKRSRLAIASLWPLGLALAVLLSVGTAEGQTQQWTKYEGNPVLERGDPGEWDAGLVDHSDVLFDGVTYRMWYAGGLVPHESDIGFATSTDGVTWTKYAGNPVLERGAPGEWDVGHIQPGAVLWDGALYHMWYGGCVSGELGPCATGYATSEDGVNWIKYAGNPVLPVGETGSWDSLGAFITAVVAEGGSFRSWYWGAATWNWISIGYATSTDGVHWDKWPDPVFWPRTVGWDRLAVGFPMVVQDGGVYRMWYTGGPWGCAGIGHAVSADGINWAREPLWEAVLSRGVPGEWDRSCIFSSRLVLEGGTAHMWYNGINSQDVFAIGYATAPLPFLEAWLFADDFESGDTSTWSATVP
jgi:hypothetical protein